MKKAKISRLAIASLIILILYVCLRLSITVFISDLLIAIGICFISITLAIIAMVKIQKNKETMTGAVFALTGIIFSLALIVLTTASFCNTNKVLLRLEVIREKYSSDKTNQQLPTTYEQAVNYLLINLSEDDIKKMRSTSKYDLIKFHFGWALGIRNDFGLWGENPELLSSCAEKKGSKNIHPDDASMLIIEGVWAALQ